MSWAASLKIPVVIAFVVVCTGPAFALKPNHKHVTLYSKSAHYAKRTPALQRNLHYVRRTRSVSAVGLAASHDLSVEGGRVCFAQHYHYGSSSGAPSVRLAQAEAVKSWADFVDFEYGSAWSNYRKASSKDMKCSRGAGGYGCDVSARPCK